MTTTHRYDMTAETMSCISTLNDSAQLRVSHTSLLTSGTHRSWADPNLDNVSTAQYQLFHHLTCDHITSLRRGEEEEEEERKLEYLVPG